MSDERLRLWLDFFKWFLSSIIITGGIGWATTLINAKHKDTELAITKAEREAEIEIKKYEKEMSYLEQFLDRAVDSPLEKRHKFAQYLAHVVTSSDYKQGWASYLEAIEGEIKAVREEQIQLENQLVHQQGLQLERAQKRISDLAKRLAGEPQNLIMSPLRYIPVKDLTTFLGSKGSCPADSKPALNFMQIHIPEMQEHFPPENRYVVRVCVSQEDEFLGPFTAYYESGRPIQTGVFDTEQPTNITVFYQNGEKAAEWQEVHDEIIVGTFEAWPLEEEASTGHQKLAPQRDDT
jgi:hypothetical protein